MFIPELHTDVKLSLSERVYSALKQAILFSQIKPREYLIIGDIAKHYSISRTPVREAVIMLEHEGWVTKDARRGAKVIVPSIKDILDVIEFQMILEGYVARRATEILSDDDILMAGEILTESEKALSEGDKDRCRQCGAEFHSFLVKKVGNIQIASSISHLQDRVDQVRFLVFQKGQAPVEISAKQHRDIWKAIQKRDPGRAEGLMFHHITWFEKFLTDSIPPVFD